MATTNKERQAAFKSKMRNAGKRQVTLWIDPVQESAIKGVLAGSEPPPKLREFSEKEIKVLSEVAARHGYQAAADVAGIDKQDLRRALSTPAAAASLDAEYAVMDLEHELTMRGYDLDRREREIADKEKRLAQNEGRVLRENQASRVSNRERIEKLVEWFTTHKQWGSNERVKVEYARPAAEKAAEMSALSRQTKTARTVIQGLLRTYGEHQLLSDKESRHLEDASRVLGWLEQAATTAKDQVKDVAKRLKIEEDQRNKAVSAAVESVFPGLSLIDAILLSYHLGSGSDSYSLGKLRMAKPGGDKWDFNYHADDIQRSVIRRLSDKIETAIKEGRNGTEAARELKNSFDQNKPNLTEQHRQLVEQMVACLTANRLER